MIVNVSTAPTHEGVDSGVTVIVATMGAPVPFKATNAAILPVPLAAKPIDGASFVQRYVDAAPVKLTGTVAEPAHATWLAGSLTTAVGLTVSVNVCGVYAHVPP